MSDSFIPRAVAGADEMRGDDSDDADASAPLTIEFGEGGRIVLRRDTPLGTFSRTVER